MTLEYELDSIEFKEKPEMYGDVLETMYTESSKLNIYPLKDYYNIG